MNNTIKKLTRHDFEVLYTPRPTNDQKRLKLLEKQVDILSRKLLELTHPEDE
jgi:hypothetical protein